jgi:hypothetical protein
MEAVNETASVPILFVDSMSDSSGFSSDCSKSQLSASMFVAEFGDDRFRTSSWSRAFEAVDGPESRLAGMAGVGLAINNICQGLYSFINFKVLTSLLAFSFS